MTALEEKYDKKKKKKNEKSSRKMKFKKIQCEWNE